MLRVFVLVFAFMFVSEICGQSLLGFVSGMSLEDAQANADSRGYDYELSYDADNYEHSISFKEVVAGKSLNCDVSISDSSGVYNVSMMRLFKQDNSTDTKKYIRVLKAIISNKYGEPSRSNDERDFNMFRKVDVRYYWDRGIFIFVLPGDFIDLEYYYMMGVSTTDGPELKIHEGYVEKKRAARYSKDETLF